jgi:hypothetical protein
MTRKLTLVATLAATAIALIAAAAPAASANYEEIYLTDNAGVTCDMVDCVDTGSTGRMTFEGIPGQPYAWCDVDFGMRFDIWGEIELLGTDLDCDDTGYMYPSISECPLSYPILTMHRGQIYWPENGVGADVTVELPFCYSVGTQTHFNRVIFAPNFTPAGHRTFTQVGIAESTHGSNIVNATIEDTNPSDDVRVILGTP